MSSFLLDTNILIYLLKGNEKIRQLIDNNSLFISFINEMELLIKRDLQPKDVTAINSLLKACHIISMNDIIKDLAITIGRKYNLKLADSIILASAITNNITLITADYAFRKVADESNDVLLVVA